jgi:hypothetical protein
MYRRQNTSADVLFHQPSGLRRSVVNLDLQHWVVELQFAGCFFGSTLFRKLGVAA